MLYLKCIILFLIFILSSKIGRVFSKKYQERLEILQDVKTVLNNLKTKIRFTYKPLPIIFDEIIKNSIGINKKVFNFLEKSNFYMKNNVAGDAWNLAIDESKIFENEKDKKIMKNMSNMLGKTDLEGQISDIDLTISFLDEQINIAKNELIKNEKLYKNLGVIAGIGIVIILI